jgi:beta-glucuronidase
VGRAELATGARRRLGSIGALLSAVLLALAFGASPAGAQAGPYSIVPYRATPPTKGALLSDGPTGQYLLGGTWLYRPDLSDVGLADGWWHNVASTVGWSPVTIPNSYNAGDFSSASMAGWVGWYRRDFTLPNRAFAKYVSKLDSNWQIRFESVDYTATVWLNGHELGSHVGAYLPFELTLRYLKAGVNRLIVRVDNRRTKADFPPSGNLWWNFGGIADVVYLRPVARADLDSVSIRPVLSCPTCSATIDEQATVENLTGRSQTVALTGRYGSVPVVFGVATIPAGGTWRPRAAIVLRHPRLWAPRSPYLYKATLTLTDRQGRALGGYTYESGIRTIKVTAGGRLELNGRALDLRGVSIHEQNFLTGEALTLAQMRQIIGWVKDLGATIIRAHVPLNPELEQLADQDGILLWSEVPVYQTSKAYLGEPSWRARALRLLQNNIETNQNHPSILLWSVGNELPTPPTAGEAAYIAEAAAEAKRLDPTRPVTMAISDWPGVACQAAYAPLDVIGVNEYFGWFDAGGGTTDDRAELSPFLDSVRACYPHQGLMVTEFGFNGNRNGPVEARGTYAFQDNSIKYHLGVFATKRWLSGAIYFNLQDFAARPGWDGANPLGTPPFVNNGLLDVHGNGKPAFSLVSSSFHSTVQLAPARLTLSSAALRGGSVTAYPRASGRTVTGAGRPSQRPSRPRLCPSRVTPDRELAVGASSRSNVAVPVAGSCRRTLADRLPSSISRTCS